MKRKQVILLAALTALSVTCTSVLPLGTAFAAEPQSQVSAQDSTEETGDNLLSNPSFENGLDSWNGSSYGTATNNPAPVGGPTHYYLDPNGWIGQKLIVPYTGYYKVSTWVAVGGSGAYFGANNDTTGERHGVDIDTGSTYTRYEQEVWMNQGEQIDVFMLANSAGWVNGDEFSLTYNTFRFPNLAVSPKFESDTVWTKTGNAVIENGQAVLSGESDAVSQSITIPQDGPYYAEVELENADGAVVSFGGQTSEAVSGTQTVKVAVDELKKDDSAEIKISGTAVVKSVTVGFDLSSIPNEAPAISNLKIEGNLIADESLEASYDFSDPDGHVEGATRFQWLISDSADGEFTPIEGATDKRIALKEEWEDKYLKLEVTPVDQYEKAGETVTSEVMGPVNVNLVQDPGFEKDGQGWKGIGLSNKDAYDGLVRGIVSANGEATQSITVKKSGYYDLSAFTRYTGKEIGTISVEDEAGSVLAEMDVTPGDGYQKTEEKGIPLEQGQTVILRLTGASDKAYDIDNICLMRDREQGMPSFNSVLGIKTAPEAFETVIDRAEKTVNLSYLYGEDISSVTVDEITVSEGASSSLQAGDVIDLTSPVEVTVTGKDGQATTWTLVGDHKEKKVKVSSSNEYLEDTFNWAANKLDQFVMTGKHGPVNKDENRPDGTGEADYIPSYWAGYYDRTAFYSRDFVHQATGGQIAGLEEENYTMFNTFAKNCTEARKFYTVWALNFDGTPHTIDYKDDTNFVCEVPAQFELVEKAYKQYLWSGDERYIWDEDMFNFYTNVMTKYVELHDSNGNGIAEGTGGGIFQGTASYNERGGEPLLEAGDAIGSQYQATLAYAGILEARGDEEGAKEWYQKAADLKKYFNEEWSVAEGQEDTYARGWSTDGVTKYTGFGKENSWFMPMKLITEPGERNDAYIDYILENLGDGIGSVPTAPTNIEAYTYIPDMLFPYNRSDDAWKWMKYITSIKDEPHERPSQGTNGDYPEISFTFVSHTIEGMMGVEPNAGEGFVATSPRLPQEVADVTAQYIDIGDYELDLTHTGNTASEMTNHSDQDLTWEARFYGDYSSIKFGDETVPAEQKEINGELVSYAQVTLKAGETLKAEAAEDSDEVSKTTLEYFLNSAKEHLANGDADNAVESVRKLLEEAIAEGEAVMAKEDATREEVMNATVKLMKAIQALDMKAGNKTDLEMAVELAHMIDLEKYVEKGQQEFKDALAAAEAILADGDAMQDDIDSAWNALVDAMDNLRLKANKDALEDLLDEVSGLDLSKYTEESAAVFKQALDRANAVMEDETLSVDDQAVVDEAVQTLMSARDGLAAKADDTGDGNQGGGSGDGNSSGNGNSQDPSNGSSQNAGGNKAAKTGDSVPVGIPMAAVLASGAAVIALRKKRR